MTKKYLKSDLDNRILDDKKSFDAYLAFRKENDEWVFPYINELAAVGIPNEPLFIPKYCTDIKIQKNGYHLDIDSIDYDDPDNQECIENEGLFLIFPHNGKLLPHPIGATAYATICKRAEDDCGTMYRFDRKPNKGVLPINEKAERLTRDYLLYSDICKILIRDGKVRAVLSKEYAIMPADEVIEKLEAQLAKDHPDFEFCRASVSHEFLVAEYMINDVEMEESFRLTLNDAGADISELKAGIRFSTSDIGLSKVSASLFYECDGVRVCLDGGVALEHKGDATPEKFGEMVASIGMLFKESAERIERLGNMDIMDVAGTVKKIREKYTFIPKTSAEEVERDLAVQFPNGGTGIDVYLALNDIIQRHASISSLSPTRYLNMLEQVAKLMNLPFDEIDKNEDWKKI